ncbi:MAG: hypothetical protein K0S61_307 [Anaerocolumna sp.]|jgi:hypothetical protein|nr:hypothetical protein [Anaerocolumna sp.]
MVYSEEVPQLTSNEIFTLEVNTTNSYTNSNEITTAQPNYIGYQWQVGRICHINNMWFVPIMAAKCVRYENQKGDQFDLIRKGDIYPVVIEMDEEIPNPKRYLLINRKGQKQYWSSSDFEIIECIPKYKLS